MTRAEQVAAALERWERAWPCVGIDAAEVVNAGVALARLLRESQPEPAPEVPDAVRAWAQTYDDCKSLGAGGAWITEADTALRDWIRKEYGI